MRIFPLFHLRSPAWILPVPRGVLAVLWLGLVGVVSAPAQTNFFWVVTNNQPSATYLWGSSGWTNNLSAVPSTIPNAGGSNNYSLGFSATTGNVISTNDLGTFVLNRLSFTFGNSGSISNFNGVLVFVTNASGGAPTVNANYSNSGNRFGYLGGNLILSNNTVFGGAVPLAGPTVNLTLGGGVSGPGSLIKNDLNSLTLAGSNSYEGGTFVNAGTLNINHAWALGSGALVLSNGVILNNNSAAAVSLLGVNTQVWYGDVTFTGAQNLNMNTGSVTLAGAAPTVTVNAGNLTVGALLDGGNNFGLTKLGTGTLGLAGSNVLGGAVVVNSGTLLLTNLLGSLTTMSSLSLANGSTNLLDNRGAANANRLADTAPITLVGGTLQLVGNGGALTETVGGMTLGSGASALGATNGGILAAASLTRSSPASTLNIASSGTVRFATAPGVSNTVQPWLIFQGNNFGVHDGDGTVIRAFTNYSTTFANGSDAYLPFSTSTGGVSVSTLVLGGSLTVNPGQTLTNTGGGLIFRTTSTFNITNGSLLFAAPETVIYNDSSDSIYSPFTSGSLTKSGTGALTLGGPATVSTSTGTVRIVQGSVSQGGTWLITNATRTATLDIGPLGQGSLNMLNSSTVCVDRLFLTNMAGSINNQVNGSLSVYAGSMLILTNPAVANLVIGSSATASLNYLGGTNILRLVLNRGVVMQNGSLVRVSGNGTVWDSDTNRAISVSYVGSGNTLVIDNGGKALVGGVVVGSGATSLRNVAAGGGSSGSVLVTNGGVLQVNFISTGTNGMGTVAVSNGTLEFTAGAPTVDSKTAGSMTLASGVISFSGVANATINGQITNFAYSGANTLRLDGSTNVALAYAITNGGAFRTLELVNNGATWQGPSLLIGNGGLLRASNSMATLSAVLTNAGTVSVINGQLTYLSNVVLSGGTFLTQNGTNVFTRGLGLAAGTSFSITNGSSQVSGTISNSGTISAVNSYVTFAGPVVNSGLYVSDPSTNVFSSNLTVTASGALQGSNGDLFVFNQNFLNQSTNAAQFNLALAAVLFTNSATHLLSVSNSGSLEIGQGFASFAEVATNFAIGQLSIADGNRVTLAGNKDSLTNALYVGWLDIQGLTLGSTNSYLAVSNTLVTALSLPNINLYYDVFDNRNDWLTRWLPASPGGGYDLWGGGLLLPIPEPSTMAVAAAGLALMAFLRQRSRA